MRAMIAIFIAFIVCFYFADEIFNLLIVPYERAAGPLREIKLIYTAPQEYFFTQMKLALFGALFLAFPVIANQIYKFVAPGLYRNERHAFLPFLIATPDPLRHRRGARLFPRHAARHDLLPLHGAGGRRRAGVDRAAAEGERISQPHHDADLRLRPGVPAPGDPDAARPRRASSRRTGCSARRKYAIVIAFIVAAVLTPPDPISQISLAIPRSALYEISIYAVRMIEQRRAAARAAEAAAAE